MTTIAYRFPQFAADRQITDGSRKSSVEKLHRFRDPELGNCIFGGAGDWRAVKRFVRWLQSGRKGRCPNTSQISTLVVIRRTGKAEMWESDNGRLMRTEIAQPYTAIGSGTDHALGAMHLGASARRAVRAAAEHDTLTGKGIQVITLRPPHAP